MENTILNSYLREITKFPKLSKEEELELGCQFCDENNPYAREKLIKHNLRLAVKEAFKFKGEKVELLELIQEGTEGLIEAVDRYDYKFGYRLAVYAEWWIAQYIKKAIMEKNRNFPAHIPINVQMEHSNINMATELKLSALWAGQEGSLLLWASLTFLFYVIFKQICLNVENVLKNTPLHLTR